MEKVVAAYSLCDEEEVIDEFIKSLRCVQDTHEIEKVYNEEWHEVTPKKAYGGRKVGSPILIEEAQDSQ
eukprot:11336224-Karenia_brevis.AAC.1